MTKIINLFSGPGAGKSTTAAGLFYEMKKRNLSVELVTEYAKEMVFEQRMNILGDQLYILAKQHRKISRLVGQVDYIVTDAPFLFGLVYVEPTYLDEFEPLVHALWDQYDHVNFFLDRADIPYEEFGRGQTYEEAKLVDEKVKQVMMAAYAAPLEKFATVVKTSPTVVNDILAHLKID